VNQRVNHVDELDELDELDAGAGGPAPMDEFEYEESEGAEIAAEVELLRARVQAARFSGA
jgi:hypothetical protein